MGLIFCILMFVLGSGNTSWHKEGAGYDVEETKDLQCDTVSVIFCLNSHVKE